MGNSFKTLTLILVLLFVSVNALVEGSSVFKRIPGYGICKASFASATLNGNLTAVVSFGQNTKGFTFIYGLVCKGLPCPEQNNYTFHITDKCGQITHNLTHNVVPIKFEGEGTKPFFAKLPNSFLNLDCTSKGILRTRCDDTKVYGDINSKRAIRIGSRFQVRNSGRSIGRGPVNTNN
jgi:hypothetical protein